MAPTEQRRRPGGARPDGPLLERDQIIETALSLTRRHGLDGMSMRKLGQELGVTSMAIYWYFSGRDELVDAITETVLESITLPDAPDETWEEQLRLFGWAVHDVLVEYPGIADQLITRQNYPPAAVRLVEYSMGVLRAAGFDDLNAATAFNVLSSYVVTRSHFEAYQRLVSEQQEASVNERAQEGWERLAEVIHESPNAASYVQQLGALDDTDLIFARGLDLILRGLRDEMDD